MCNQSLGTPIKVAKEKKKRKEKKITKAIKEKKKKKRNDEFIGTQKHFCDNKK